MKDPSTVPKIRKKPPCRRRRRRPRDVQQVAEKHREGKSRWLETHIWHAKRALMEDSIWGFRLATRPNEKCLRSCVKSYLGRQGTSPYLYDCSYYQIVEVRGPVEEVVVAKIEIFDDAGQFVGPALRIPVTDGLYWLLVHPSIGEVVEKRYSSSAKSINIFQLCGQSEGLLQRALGLDNRLTMCWKIQDPRIVFPKAPSAAEPEAFSDEFLASLFDPPVPVSEASLNQLCAQSIIPGSPISHASSFPLVTVAVNGGGVLLIVPKGWGRPVWRSLIYGGCRFGGLRETRHGAFEARQRFFPDDYPFTEEHRLHARHQTALELAAHAKRPPAKRTNYRKFGFQSDLEAIDFYALFPPASGQEDFRHVWIEMKERRGVPMTNALIYPFCKDASRETLGDPIGRVLYGSFSWSTGGGAASAVVQAKHAIDGSLVLVRNCNTWHFNVGSLKLE